MSVQLPITPVIAFIAIYLALWSNPISFENSNMVWLFMMMSGFYWSNFIGIDYYKLENEAKKLQEEVEDLVEK